MYFENDNSNAPLNASNKLFEDSNIGDVRRVSEEDIKQLASNYETSNIINKLNRLIEDYADKEKRQEAEIKHMELFNQYVMRSCSGQWCNCLYKVSLQCTDCILRRNCISWGINDGSTIYFFEPQNYFFTLADDKANLISCFRLYPMSASEIESTFYLHQKWIKVNLFPKSFQNIIRYDIPINIIHYRLVQKLLRLYHMPNILSEHNTPNKQINAYANEREKIFMSHFNLPEERLNEIQNLTEGIAGRHRVLLSKTNSPFVKMLKVLFAISNGNQKTIEQLALLLAKIYLGRSYLHVLYKDAPNLTILHCNNTNYIKSFVCDIVQFTLKCSQDPPLFAELYPSFYIKKSDSMYFHLTEYSMNYLCDEDKLSILIQDKFRGNIVNVDSYRTSSSINTNTFKKLVNGTKISANGISYRSNAHYIRIVDDINNVGFDTNDISHEVITFTGDLHNAIYEPLDDHELYFMLTGFLEYGIDLLARPVAEIEKTAIVSNEELINTFIADFCIDTTDTIPKKLLDGIAVNEIKDEKLKKVKVEELKIDQLEFTHTDLLHKEFERWLASAHKSMQCCTNTEFKNVLDKKYHDIFYIKKRVTLDSGEVKDARGFYGLSVKKAELNQFIENTKLQPDVSLKEREEAFKLYLSNIISTYRSDKQS